MSTSPKVQRDRKRRGLCLGCGEKPKPKYLRCEGCLAKQRGYDKAYREKQKGGKVEPACKPSKGPMRPEHSYDEDGICTACGTVATRLRAPEPWPDPPAETTSPPPKPRPGRGPHKWTKEHSAAFFRGVHGPPREDVATIRDPLLAALAALELERDEITIAIETLKRLQGRKASARCRDERAAQPEEKSR